MIYEDIPVGVYLKALSLLPGVSANIMRSHNVLADAFKDFQQDGTYVSQCAWRIEVARIRRFEESVLKAADLTYAISRRDAARYSELYDASNVTVLPLKLGSHLVDGVDCSTANDAFPLKTFICLGSFDMRKEHGMKWFIEHCFAPLRRSKPEVELLLGGNGSERFTRAEMGINGLGFVESEGAFMRQGQVFVNPQLRGSGVKLKSLIAMLYGKCLITTSEGIEGIDVVDGVHCLIADNESGFIDAMTAIIDGRIDPLTMGKNARSLVLERYCEN